MNQASKVAVALALGLLGAAAGAAEAEAESKLIGAWQEGLTPALAAGTPEQLRMAKKAGLLGSIVQYKPDHTFVMYPACGPKLDELRKAGFESINGTWSLTPAGDMVSTITAMGRSMSMQSKLRWQDGQMVIVNKGSTVGHKSGAYSGPLPPSC